MNGTKNTLKSLGVMGPVIGLIAMVLNAVFGDNTITADEAGIVVDQVTAIVYAVSAAWTVATAVIGRIRARRTLSIKAPLTAPKPDKLGAPSGAVLAALALSLLLLASCSLFRGLDSDLDKDLNREDLGRAELSWQTTLGIVKALADARVIKGETAARSAELIRKVQTVMEKWRANPDDTSAKALALAAIAEFSAFEKAVPRPVAQDGGAAPTGTGAEP